MKWEKILGIVVIVVLLSSLAVGFVSGNVSGNAMKKINERGVKGYTPHGVIRINNDTDFANQASQEGWPGDGTESNPYIISGYDIDANGAGDAIYIGNITVYFVVENCYLHNAAHHSYPYFDGDGIMFYSVKNGIIRSNKIMNNSKYGISLDSNLWYHNSNNTISGNNIANNGDDGIYLYFSSNNNIRGNNITKNKDGIYLWDSDSNTINGNNITNSVYYGIWLDSSSSNTISGNNITNNSDDGIELWDSSSNNIISGNNIMSNSRHGVCLDDSSDNTISDNNITNNNWYGIDLENSADSNTIYNNLIFNNSDYGIYIDSCHYNLIYNNSFYYNHGSGDTYDSSHVQANDTGSNNYWNTSGTPHGYGNYWHDWANNNNTNDQNNDGIVDWPYPIDGSAGAKDHYPLKNTTQPIPEFSTGIWLFIVILISLLGVIKVRKSS